MSHYETEGEGPPPYPLGIFKILYIDITYIDTRSV